MRFAAALLVPTATLLLESAASTCRAEEVLFQEGFEFGFSGQGWLLYDGLGGAQWVLDTARSHTGTSSLRIIPGGPTGATAMIRDVGVQSGENLTLEAWFWDGMENSRESLVAVSTGGGSGSSGWLQVGTDCINDPNHYFMKEGYGGAAYGPPRSLGWHKVTIRRDGLNWCYVDDQLIATTAFATDWRELILFENNLCPGESWFDDLRIYRDDTGLPADPTLSTATSNAVSLVTCPGRDAPSLAAVGGTVAVTVRNTAGSLIVGYPTADVWLGGATTGSVTFCAGGLPADNATDASGRTTISGVPAAGGCGQDGLRAFVGGQPITGSAPLPISINGPDLSGDLHVDLADIGPFSTALNGGPFTFCADFYRDGRIDLTDVSIMSTHLGHRCE